MVIIHDQLNKVLEKRGLLTPEELAMIQKLSSPQFSGNNPAPAPSAGDGTPRFDR
jgi:hypothetical protein